MSPDAEAASRAPFGQRGTESTVTTEQDHAASPRHPLHTMMARAGSFPPSLADRFIQSNSDTGDTVIDPFCGKGTTVLQAVLRGRRAIGSDVAPEAVTCTRAKVTQVSLKHISAYVRTLKYERHALSAVPSEVRVFYNPRTLSRLLSVRDRLRSDLRSEKVADRRAATFLLGVLLGILHGHASYSLSLTCSHVFGMAPNYVRKYAKRHNLEAPDRDVRECLASKARLLLSRGSVPHGLAQVYESSAEKYSFDDGELTDQVSLVVTSPPYLNAQTYAKDAWLRLWLLGYDYREIRPRYLQTASVQTYRERMKPCLSEMLRVLQPQGSAFLIAGDVFIRRKHRRVSVRTAAILAEAAETLGSRNGFRFRVESIAQDSIPSHLRCYSAVHKDANSHWDESGSGTGVRIDRVLHLRKVPA